MLQNKNSNTYQRPMAASFLVILPIKTMRTLKRRRPWLQQHLLSTSSFILETISSSIGRLLPLTRALCKKGPPPYFNAYKIIWTSHISHFKQNTIHLSLCKRFNCVIVITIKEYHLKRAYQRIQYVNQEPKLWPKNLNY